MDHLIWFYGVFKIKFNNFLNLINHIHSNCFLECICTIIINIGIINESNLVGSYNQPWNKLIFYKMKISLT